MKHKRYKNTSLSKSLWLTMSVFLIVFTSCPVRKYIRLQLYKQQPTTQHSASPERYAIKDVKDCTVADKHQDGQVIISDALLGNFDGDAIVPVFFSSVLTIAALLYIKRNEQSFLFFRPRRPELPSVIPLYLQVRHIRIWFSILFERPFAVICPVVGSAPVLSACSRPFVPASAVSHCATTVQ